MPCALIIAYGILTFNQKVREASPSEGQGNALVMDRRCEALAFALEKLAILDALHKLHLNFGFLVRDVAGGFRRHDQRLRAIGQIKGALELQRLDATLLAGVLLQRGLEHLRLGMQLEM